MNMNQLFCYTRCSQVQTGKYISGAPITPENKSYVIKCVMSCILHNLAEASPLGRISWRQPGRPVHSQQSPPHPTTVHDWSARFRRRPGSGR